MLIITILILGCNQSDLQGNAIYNPNSFNGSYKIGAILALTGDVATYGIPEQKVIEIAVHEINSKGGIKGKKLEIIYEDGKCNPKDGNAAAQKLIHIDKVKVIIGGSCSSETLGAAPIAEANKVIMIAPSSTSPDITKSGDFIFRVSPSDANAGIVAADYAFDQLRARKAALITESSSYPQGLRRIFRENFVKLGGKVVADEVYNPDDTDFRAQVAKVKSANPDLIYIVPQAHPKGILLIKEIKEAQLKQQLLTAEVLIGRNVIKEYSEYVEGLIGVEQEFNDSNPKAAALFKKYREQSKEEPPFPTYMAGAYDIVYLISDAISVHGNDSGKIRDYLYAVNNYNGALGNITMDKNGDPIMKYNVKQVRNGKLIILK